MEDFERIVEEYRLIYGDETEESLTDHQTFLTNGKEKTTRKTTSSKLRIIRSGTSIFEVAHQVPHTVARYCEYCPKPMTPSDVNDYGSLCESCYMKEYYND